MRFWTSRRRSIRRAAVVASALLLLAGGRLAAIEPSFDIDVMAVLSKAGCNAGACHGNQNGKGGFKLSLRGQDPSLDFIALTREHGGRRINLLNVGESLMLRKPTMQVPHQGGKRFDRESVEHTILSEWLAAGARGPDEATPKLTTLLVEPESAVITEPDDQLQLRVTAAFSDGSQRDMTNLAVYETSNLVTEVDRGGRVTRRAFGESTVHVRLLGKQAAVTLALLPARNDFVWSHPPEGNFIDQHVHA